MYIEPYKYDKPNFDYFYSACTDLNCVAKTFINDNKLKYHVRKFFNYKDCTNDIIQDVCIIILEYKNPELLLKVCHDFQFHFWLFGVLQKQKITKNSVTNKNYFNSHIQLDENIQVYDNTIEQNEHKSLIIELIKEELNNMYESKEDYCHSNIFRTYSEKKEEYRLQGKKLTYAEFGKFMDRDKDSLWVIIQKVKTRLKNKLNEL